MGASYAQLAPEEDREAWHPLLLAIAFFKGGRSPERRLSHLGPSED